MTKFLINILWSVVSSNIKHTFGWPCPFVFLIAEWTMLVLDIFELVFVQSEELAALLAWFEEKFRNQILVISHTGCWVQFPQILHIHGINIKGGEDLRVQNDRDVLYRGLLLFNSLIHLVVKGCVHYYINRSLPSYVLPPCRKESTCCLSDFYSFQPSFCLVEAFLVLGALIFSLFKSSMTLPWVNPS